MAEKKTVSSISTKKMYTTSTGARQFGSAEDARKHAEKVFLRFIRNPNRKNYELLERMDAAKNAALAKKLRDIFGKGNTMADFFDRMEERNLSEAQKKKAQSLFKRMSK